MLETLWDGGRIGIARRDGNERLWDIAERVFPPDAPKLPAGEIARRVLDGSCAGSELRARRSSAGSSTAGFPAASAR